MSELFSHETFVEPAPKKSNTSNNPPLDGLAGPIYRPEQKNEAIREFDLEEKSSEINGLLSQALLLIDNGDYRLAQAILRGALEKNPYFAEAIRWQSYCFKQLGDLENAIRCALARSKLVPSEESYCFIL
jgi:Flp pilus assembly protein TadD